MEQVSPKFFKPQDAFFSQEQYPYLKGFKGKGVHDSLENEYQQIRDQLIRLGRESVLPQVKAYPFALLPIELAMQTTSAGTAFLRWRKRDRSEMGVKLWDELMCSNYVSRSLIDDLYAIEIERISLNMSISNLHSMARRAAECTLKVAHAKLIYQQRMNSMY